MTSNKRAKVMATDAAALPTYLLLVLRGLEYLVEEEIRQKLEVCAVLHTRLLAWSTGRE